jgi:phosphinothricin acetyltransferase
MKHPSIRAARPGDLERIREILNEYILHHHATFDVEAKSTEEMHRWFEQFRADGPHRLLVAEEDGAVSGYASSTRFRPKTAYDTTVETTIYLAPGGTGRGVGTRLYRSLLDGLPAAGVHLAVAGIARPNPGSEALHRKLGFTVVGTFAEVGRKFGRYRDVTWFQKPLST